MEISRPPDVTRPPQDGRSSYQEMAKAYMRILDRETKRNSVLQGSLEFTMARSKVLEMQMDVLVKEIKKLSSFIGNLPVQIMTPMLENTPAEKTPLSIFLTEENLIATLNRVYSLSREDLTRLFIGDIQLQEE